MRGVEVFESKSNLSGSNNNAQFWVKGRSSALSKFGIVRVETTGGAFRREASTCRAPPDRSAQEPLTHNFPSASATQKHVKQEMVKVPSMLFDLETEDTVNGSGSQTETQLELTRLLTPKTVLDLQITESIISVLQEYGLQEVSLPDLAVYLESKGINVKMRNALGGNAGSECLRELRHSFIIYTTNDEVNYIIDPTFKAQFAVAHPSEQYQTLLDSLPDLYVAREDSLVMLVHFLCKQMEKSFLEMGDIMPPWRSRSAVLSMWKPRRSLDQTPREIATNPYDPTNTYYGGQQQPGDNKNNEANTGSEKFFIPVGQDELFAKEKECLKGSGDSIRSVLSEVLAGDSESSSPRGVNTKGKAAIADKDALIRALKDATIVGTEEERDERAHQNARVSNKPMKSCLSSELAMIN
eukprot:TRINITY_DN10474_c0_g1_i4.p1 TRINITY_DN10474_c0_g1~~TRINITY_DN10474_c0_g1_i4.p1  ORF type:complete len:411 (-),score=61.45 TRINITY_DN10474_c0_g1_i4:1942-3174(-)